MTKAEYVRLSLPEQNYGQKHLLASQLELLNLITSFRKYKDLRNEELVLKITLKNKVEETLGFIDKLEKSLPKADYEKPTHKSKKEISERKLSLQEEIEKIRNKLAKLNRESY